MKNSKIESNEEFFADEFFKLMEHYITRDFGMITISSDVINYRVSIFRKNGRLHKELISDNDDYFDMSVSPSGNFVYENLYENIRNIMIQGINYDKYIGITLLSKLGEHDEINCFHNLHGFQILIENGELNVVKLDSKTLYKCYTTNNIDGSYIEPDKNAIYCGISEDDKILGMDKL